MSKKRNKQPQHTYGGKITYSKEHDVTLVFRKPITTYPFKNETEIHVKILPPDIRGRLLYKLPNVSGDQYKRMPKHVRSLIYAVIDANGNDVTHEYPWVKRSKLDEQQLLRVLDRLKFKIDL